MLKGIAIFMVVMGHVLAIGVRGIDSATIFKFIGAIHMPLFFFISGWFTMKVLPDGSLRRPNLKQRAIQLLLPMVVVSTMWIFYYPHSGLQSPFDSTFAGLWSNEWKNGYWFTPALFIIMLVYWLITPVLKRLKNIWLSMGFVVLLWVILMAVGKYLSPELLGYTGYSFIAQFTPVFLVGAIAARNADGFNQLTEKSAWTTASIVAGAFLLYVICWPWEFKILDSYPDLFSAAVILFHIALAVVAVSVVRPWSEKAFAPEASAFTRGVAKVWQLLGRKSLTIYLLHYFFLFPLTDCGDVLRTVSLGFTPLFFFAAIIAAAIVAMVLLVDAIIQRSSTLSLLLTGTR